jgi:cobalamin biosynthesis protein CobT
MKQFIIDPKGNINYKATSADASQLYGKYDDTTFSVHLSETVPTSKAQIQKLKDVMEKATGSVKAPQRVKQRSKNVIGFSLADETDPAVVKQAKNDAFTAIFKEAEAINLKMKGQQQNNNGQQQQNNNGQQQQNGNGQQQNGNGQKQQNGNGQKQQNGNGQQQNNNGQQQQNGNGQQQTQQKTIDKSKDAFGRPLETAYPGLFYPNMTQKEKEEVYDEYWDMVQHVDKDIFGRK